MTGRERMRDDQTGGAGRESVSRRPGGNQPAPTSRPGSARAGSAAGPAPVRLRRVPLPVLLSAMLLAGLCALLALNTASAAQELTQRNLTDSNANTSDIEQQLVRDLAAKQAPAALASQALALGLVPNPNPAFLRINADGSVTVLGSPTPASVPPPPTSAPRSPAATPTGTPRRSATAGKSSPTAVATVTVTRSAPVTPASTSKPSRPSSTAPRPTASPSSTGGH
jgi:hypothetical protein